MKSILLIGLGRFGRHIAQELNGPTGPRGRAADPERDP